MAKQSLVITRVKRGVKLLTEHGYDLCSVDKEALNLQSTSTCVLGQLHGGSYFSGKMQLMLSSRQVQTHGFEADAKSDIGYGDLTTAWRDMLETLCPSPAQ